MRSDGAIVFNTKIDNSNVEKDLQATKRKIEKANKEIAESGGKKLPLLEDAKRLGAELDAAKDKLAQLQAQQEKTAAALAGSDPAAYIDAYAAKPGIDLSVDLQQKEVERLQNEWNKINIKVDRYDQKIENAKVSLAQQTEIAGQLSAQLTKGGNGMAEAMQKVDASAKRISKRLFSLVASALIFSALSEGLRHVREYMGKALKTNEEYTAQLAKLKGALLTAFQPVYEFLVPALISLMKIATAVIQAVAHVAAFLGGKSASEYAASAKALYEEANAIEETGDAAKKAQRYLAGFDEINKLGGNSDTSTSTESTSITPDFTDFSTEEYAQKIDEITLLLSGALLALGAILTFSGANIPLGIGLMALGAIGLASEAAMNWNAIVEALQGPIGVITAIASAALLVLGLILALSGSAIPLGIGLIAVGAAGLATTAAVNWNSIVQALQGPIGAITALASAALLAMGIVLVCTGGNIPLGIAMIAAGAAGLVTVTAINWNFIVDKVKDMWTSIKQWFVQDVAPKLKKEYWINKIFSGISAALPEAWKPGINKVIAMVNEFTSWLNDKLTIEWDAFTVGGKEIIPAGSYSLVDIPELPYLAQGAVIPPNREFMAVLGDQKHGTNIEAPADLIRKIVREEIGEPGGMSVSAMQEVVGRLDQLIDVVCGIEVGDTTIGQAANRFNAKMSIITGGNA